MNKMLHGFGLIWIYIDGLLTFTKGDFSNNLEILKLIQKNLKENGLKYNIGKSLFGQADIEYLSFLVTRNGIRLINKK